jgi:predicted 3-demethylubiquinone-9 3-methyltransferase (glyoxalase superfamily)
MAARRRARQKITTFLWFDDNAEKAAKFYVSIFPGSKILDMARYGAAGPGKPGSVMTIRFRLAGQEFVGLNGGPVYKFTEAVSLWIDCDDQAEIDRYWRKLAAGGQIQACGWLKDKFGLSWQVVPRVLIEMLEDRDKERAGRVMQAMLKMRKIDIAKLERAYRGAR